MPLESPPVADVHDEPQEHHRGSHAAPITAQGTHPPLVMSLPSVLLPEYVHVGIHRVHRAAVVFPSPAGRR
jgi:hypothetical protein